MVAFNQNPPKNLYKFSNQCYNILVQVKTFTSGGDPDDDHTGSIDHYYVLPGLTAPMQLYLYEYDTSGIRNLAGWTPTDEQWWVTGFNANHVGQADVTKQVVIGSVDFSKFRQGEHNYLFESIKKYTMDEKNNRFVIFDDSDIMWLIWGEF